MGAGWWEGVYGEGDGEVIHCGQIIAFERDGELMNVIGVVKVIHQVLRLLVLLCSVWISEKRMNYNSAAAAAGLARSEIVRIG